jgi:type II secretory pathway component PulM
VAALAAWAWLWEPPAAGIRKLEADLPVLRGQSASMRAMADEAARLRLAAGNAVPVAAGDRVAAVRRSLERAGLSSASAVPRPVEAAPAPATSIRTRSSATTVTAASAARAAPPEVHAEGDRVRVRFDDVDYGVWVAWLAASETELSARATRVSIATTAPKGPVGHVRTEALLDWTTPATPAPRS